MAFEAHRSDDSKDREVIPTRLKPALDLSVATKSVASPEICAGKLFDCCWKPPENVIINVVPKRTKFQGTPLPPKHDYVAVNIRTTKNIAASGFLDRFLL